MAEFAMLEENMHCLPQRVIENLGHLLMHEWIFRSCICRVRTLEARKRERHRALKLRLLKRGPHFGVSFGRTESHDAIFAAKNRLQPWPKLNREIESRQGALANDHGMNKFHRHMLRVRSIGTTSESQKPAS